MKTVVLWDNKSAPGGAINTTRGLTRSLDLTKEGLAMKATRICAVAECDLALYCRGYCTRHYARLSRHGDPLAGRPSPGSMPARVRRPPAEGKSATEAQLRILEPRIAARYTVTDGDCWEWTHRLKSGYGGISLGKAGAGAIQFKAHRISWQIANGYIPVPAGMVVCHACDNPPCINPAHLFLGTLGDNNEDKRLKGRQARAKDIPWTVLDEQRAAGIKAALAGGATKASLARTYGVSETTIWKIARGISWSYVDAAS